MLGWEGSDIDGGTENLGRDYRRGGVSGTGVKGGTLIWRQGKGDGKRRMEREANGGVTGHEAPGGGSHDEVNF